MASSSFRRMLWKTPMRDLVRGRITGRLDIERLLDESGLSGEATEIVRRVVKYTRLWRLEKVDVARELISHFTDGQEADVPLHELVKTFGDERQTAKLIRRAKKRQRPMPWHLFAWARLCLGVFFGVYFLAALYLMAGSPSVTTDYLAKLNAKAAAVPEGEAAWPIYSEALLQLNLYEVKDWESPIPYYRDLPPDAQVENTGKLEPPYLNTRWERIEKSLHPNKPGWEETRAFLNKHADTLARVREGANRHNAGYIVGFQSTEEDKIFHDSHDGRIKSYLGPHPPLIGVELSHLSEIRSLTRIIHADASRAIDEEDGQSALANIIAVLGLASHCNEQPLLITGLVRLSIQRMAYRSTQELLLNNPEILSDEQLRNLAHRIAAIEVSSDEWFDGERLWFYDYLQRTYTDDGRGGGRITSHGMDAVAMYDSGGPLSMPPSTTRSATIAAGLPVAAALIAPRDEMRELYDSLMDQTIIESHKPLWIDDGTESVEVKFERLKSSIRNQIRYGPILIFFPSLTAVSRTLHTQEGYRDGVLIGIALELYRREHGDWPGALEDLVPGYLPVVPVDRLTGELVKYVIGEGGPVVYSIGVDGDDDGGRPPVERDGDIANDMASPKRFTGDAQTQKEYDGDWVLWPVPDEE